MTAILPFGTHSRPTPSLAAPAPARAPAALDQPGAARSAAGSNHLDNPAALATAFGDACNWRVLAECLQAIARTSNAQDSDLASRLKNSPVSICEDSSYYRRHALTPTDKVTLEAFLRDSGLSVPNTLAELIALNGQVVKRAQTPPLGNFGGALSWPIPLTLRAQGVIKALLRSSDSGLPGLPLADPAKGVLGYLLSGSSVTSDDLGVATRAMEKLLGSPKAQALGLAIQTALGGLPTDSSINDYLMAAIQLGLDPEPAPNKVGGYDLAQPGHRRQPASAIIEGLGRHLVAKGLATAQTAKLAAYLSLAPTAPEYLVRDIPKSVTYGSLTWTQLAIATARIEADMPGRTLGMSYAEVLVTAEQLDTPEALLQDIQQKALADWGVANGLLGSDAPTQNQREAVRVEYNRQMAALSTVSRQLSTPTPSRREMALDALQAAFPDLDPAFFEVPSLVKMFRVPGRTGRLSGLRSMLDVVMHGEKLGAKEHWESSDKRIPASLFCSLYESGKLDVANTFENEYKQAIATIEKGHQGLTQYLLTTLPEQDRKNLEYGALEFFHTNDYTLAPDLFSKPTLKTRGHTLRVKTTLGGEVNIYEIDTQKATIEKQNYWITRYTPPYTDKNLHQRDANVVSKTVLFNPFKDERPDLAQAQTVTDKVPAFDSARSVYIGRVFANSLDLHNEDLKGYARGWTSFDDESARNQALGEFFLNLIPLRSAVKNFINGNVAEGLFDLSVDLIGLVTLGAGKVVQAGKILSKGLTTLRAAAKLSQLVGTTVIQAFNPVGGLGDLTVGTGLLVSAGGRRLLAKGQQVVHKLRGGSGGYDLLKAASKQYGEAATGILKVAGHSTENGAVLHKGKWYGFDPDRMRPYGPPLDGFTPRTRALDGAISPANIEPSRALSNTQFGNYKVPASSIAGLTPNSRGVYVAADGHLSYIRHTDSDGLKAVYEVRQVTRTADGAVQARIYHNNRQTPLLVEHVQGDQWQRLGAKGGVLPSVKADLGPVIGGGGEGVVYASLDGKSVYKDLGVTRLTTAEGYTSMEVVNLNKYYGEGFAEVIIDGGRKYIKMGRIDGIDLSQIKKGSLPASARTLLDDAFAEMEAKDVFHNDPQMKNFMYSAKDNKVYPVDMDGLPGEFMVSFISDVYARKKEKARREFAELLTQAS